MRAGADGAGEFADGHRLARGFEPSQRAAKFVVHQRQLQAEGRRFGVDAVAAADAGRELVFLARLAAMTLRSAFTSAMRMSADLHHLHGEGGVDDVAAGQAEMEPAAGGVVDVFGDGGGEGDDVVVERLFQFALARDEAGQIGEPFVAAGLDLREILGGHDAFLDQRFAGEQFDLQPDA